MSTKEWTYTSNERFGVYQEITFEKDNHNPATIEVVNPEDFSFSSETTAENARVSLLTLEIPAEVFDEIAIAWCRKRKLHCVTFNRSERRSKHAATD
ncbi:hypothetical protein DU002_14620 [Corallincola holothuriorum]|uniref:Uncharacterized protein n=1 Tax=Corallincola holothuriorum TaxID=2282215 RepID=A0A368N6C3_9GAMM|nr:hypothetical protein [Corallincola holothuriorum]RCU45690.1 hypothetical protein DU002_14620 [Corallincola holothuriorum]